MGVRNIARCGLSAALLTVCGWVSVPLGQTAFTMQTFGVFLTLLLLGGKWGTVTVGVYLLLGAAGLPVFSGFRGGTAVLLGATGGYLWGFLATALLYWAVTGVKNTSARKMTGLILGQLLCYALGTAWFSFGYLQESAGLGAVLLSTVVPYLLPDGCKLLFACFLEKKLRRFV